MAQRGWSVTGVEMFDRMAHEAVTKISAVVRADVGLPLPLRDAAFDAVFAGEIIEHLVDTDLFLSEIARVLRPGGVAIVTAPNLASFENRLRLAIGKHPRWVEYRVGGEGHVRAYTPKILRSQMAEHGLVVRTHLGNWVPFVPQRLSDDVRHPWVAWTGKVFPSLAMDIIFEAERVYSPSRPRE